MVGHLLVSLKNKMEKKIILTERELYDIIFDSYYDGFEYCRDFDEIFKKHNDSQGKDICSYTKNKIKELLKEC